MSEFSALPDPVNKQITPTISKMPTESECQYRLKVARCRQSKTTKQLNRFDEDDLFDTTITMAEDKQTTMAKNNQKDVRRVTIDVAHVVATK